MTCPDCRSILASAAASLALAEDLQSKLTESERLRVLAEEGERRAERERDALWRDRRRSKKTHQRT